MVIRYLVFVLVIAFLITGIAFFVKPVPLKRPEKVEYKDPVSVIKDFYSGYLWKDLHRQKDFSVKFNIIKKTISYNENYRSIYNELCSSVGDYLAARVNIDEVLTVIKKGIELYNDEQYVICYLKALSSIQGYSQSIDFLKELHEKTNDPYKKVWYLEKIKEIEHEQNILFLTRAVEKYYQDNKIYPGDILVLVEQGIIDDIPEEPYGGQYFIGKQGQIRSTSERGDKKR